MRPLVLVLLASIPLSADVLETSAACNGSTNYGTDSASCGSNSLGATGASAVIVINGYVSAGAWVGTLWDYSSASALSIEDYILTVYGYTGSGYAEPIIPAFGGQEGSFAVAGASASLGGCTVSVYGDGYSTPCSENSVSFVSGVPQQLTFTQSASAMAGPYGAVEGETYFQGFLFFNDQFQPLGDVPYSFAPGDIPEPGTLPLFAIGCAALIVWARRARVNFARSRRGPAHAARLFAACCPSR
jgi:hypothetical protein